MAPTAWPRWRPASAIARRQATSPSMACSTISSAVSSWPRLERSSSTSASPAAKVSRQPRLPQRHMRAVLVDGQVADLAGGAAGAVEQAPADDQPGADAGGHLQVDEVGGALVRHPRTARPARPGWRRCPRARARPGGPPSPRATCRPSQPGRIADEPTWPEGPWMGPGRPRPTPSSCGRRHVGALEHLLHELGGGVHAVRGVVALLHLAPVLGQQRVREVGHHHGQVALAEVDAQRRAGARAQADRGGRAARAAGRRVAVGAGPVHHQALVAHLGHQAGDRGARQPGVAGHVGPAGHAELAQRVDHAAPVQLAHGRRRIAVSLSPTAARVSIVTRRLCQGRGQIHREFRLQFGPEPTAVQPAASVQGVRCTADGGVMLTPTRTRRARGAQDDRVQRGRHLRGRHRRRGPGDRAARRPRELARAGHRRPGHGRRWRCFAGPRMPRRVAGRVRPHRRGLHRLRAGHHPRRAHRRRGALHVAGAVDVLLLRARGRGVHRRLRGAGPGRGAG